MRFSHLITAAVICAVLGMAGCNRAEKEKTPQTSGTEQSSTSPQTEAATDTQTAKDGSPIAPFNADQAKAHQEASAKHLGEPVVTTNSIGMQLTVIPLGRFKMGEGASVVDVTLTKPFRLGVHEVTQSQWNAVMGARPAGADPFGGAPAPAAPAPAAPAAPAPAAPTGADPWKGAPGVIGGNNVAATCMSWEDAVEFCRSLTEQEQAAGKLRAGWEYRLPTEAEWEWACRAGTTTAYSFGDDASQLGEYAWYDSNAKNAGGPYAHAVGLKKPNGWGLYDVHGNAWEFCRDWHGDTLLGGTDPTGPAEGSDRVIRGGGCGDSAGDNRSAVRYGFGPLNQGSSQGFRVALSPVAESSSNSPQSSNRKQFDVPATVQAAPAPAPTPDRAVSVVGRLNLADIVGEYALQSATNDWHRGNISMEKDKAGRDVLRWTNAAGVSWKLNPDLPSGVLNTGPDNPYFKDAASRVFTLVLSRDGNGEYLPQVHSFQFGGSEFVRKSTATKRPS